MTSVIFLFILIFLLLNGVKNQATEESALHEGVRGSNDLHEIENLLDLLKGVPSNDPLKHNHINNLIKTLCWKIDAIAHQIPESENNSFFSVKSSASIRLEMSKLSEYKMDIKERYNQMKVISQRSGRTNNSDMETFAELNVLSGSDSIRFKLFNIYSIYLGYSNKTSFITKPLIEQLAGELKKLAISDRCLNISAQQLLYNEYLEMRLLSVQVYFISKFSMMVLSSFKEQNFIHQELVFNTELETRSLIISSKFREAITDASRELRTCDPTHWNEDTNFAQLIRLVQGFIVNEANLNNLHRCKKDCSYYDHTIVPKCYTKDPSCNQDRGFGEILTCESENNIDDITYCPSTEPKRRYEYFQIHKGSSQEDHFYGRNGTCKTAEVSLKSWRRGFYRCSYCFCLLDNKSRKSDRFINLREVVSDIEQNKVVTGLRFKKVNRVIYLQIQQGELSPLGLIRKNTTEWKNVEQYVISDVNNRIDHFTLDAEHKSVNLDDIQTKNSSFLVTGVKFDITADSHLYLKVRLTKFNFQTGLLIYSGNNSKWISNNWTHDKKVPLNNGHDGPKVSTTSPSDSVPTMNTYDYVEFTHSSKKDDAAQTTLPFFDTQDVASYSPAPLSGVGLYHRGMEGYGGFLAPKIYTADVLSFV